VVWDLGVGEWMYEGSRPKVWHVVKDLDRCIVWVCVLSLHRNQTSDGERRGKIERSCACYCT
jgi:hypothetical protein